MSMYGGDYTRCFRCNTVYPVGNQHFCGTSAFPSGMATPSATTTVAFDRTDELTRRLDRIIELLEKLEKLTR